MSFIGSVIDLSLISGMFWAIWRITTVLVDEWCQRWDAEASRER